MEELRGVAMFSWGGIEKFSIGDLRPGEMTLGESGETGEARVRVEILEVSIRSVRLIGDPVRAKRNLGRSGILPDNLEIKKK